MDKQSIAVLKGLSLDIIQNANSGHPGTTLSAAPIMYTLFTKHLKIHPSNPSWVNRDRFIMSAGHGSALLYAMLFLSGYQISIDELKNFRRFNSKTPAYPDINTIGVDASTGMQAEGFASAVGIALAERIYAIKYNKKPKNKFDKKTKPLIDYYTYVLVSDGDLMEGLSYEAASFAGNLKLNKLIVLYDHNGSTMDALTSKTFTESVTSRFSSLGFNTQIVKNGNSVSDINKAIIKAKKSSLPSFIQINTKIGDGLLNEGTNKVHCVELTRDDIEQLKKKLGAENMPFIVNKEPAEYIRNPIIQRGINKYEEWEKIYTEYKADMDSSQIMEFENINFNNLYIDLSKIDIDINYDLKESLRDSNSKIMNIISSNFYNFIGGSSDCFTSTKVYLQGKDDIGPNNFSGKNIFFGLRENLMGSVLNGLALSGFRPFGSTLLTSSNYMIPSIKMSALMNLPVTYIFTHDSITTGVDGPTFQPVEELAHLRAMPNINVYRPADIKEIIGTWKCILEDKMPSVISLARTEVKPQIGTNSMLVSKGAYIESDPEGKIDAVIIATGAEVQVANSIKERLRQVGKNIRIVSMPCMEKFYEQSEAYKQSLFPSNAKIFVIEYASSFGWEKFVESSDYLFTVDKFGVSASKDDVLKYCEVDIDTITEKIKSLI